MGSISSTNPALTNLMQTLSSTGVVTRPSQNAVSGLADASPVDVADLSESANQLAELEATMNVFYGLPTNNQENSDDTVLQALQSALTAAATAPAAAAELSANSASVSSSASTSPATPSAAS